MPLDGWDHLELWVGNAKQSAYLYEQALGFDRVAYAGPETGLRDRASYVLEQGEIRLVVTSGLRSDSEIVRFASRHGDAAKDVALKVPDAANAYREAVERGARERVGAALESRTSTAGSSWRRSRPTARTSTPSSTAPDYHGPYLPGYVSLSPNGHAGNGVGLIAIDHVVGNVELGQDEPLGRVLRAGLRDDEHRPLRRRPDPDRVLGAHEQGDGGRLREDQVPDQRARRGQAQEPDRRVPRVQRRPRASSTSRSRPRASSRRSRR